ncbi:MAG TPA: hypothetical protein VNU44_14475 [Bryobacteraceae bacterium]|nr:hypothetical protein [Bryobacteraceae bacterium]
MNRNRAIGWNLTWKGIRWQNLVLAIGGKPGLLTPAQITGAVGGVFNDASGNQFNLLAPGSSRLEQIPFRVKASGWVKIPAGTFTATLVAALYGVAGAAAWTAASGNQIAASTSLSITQSGTTAVVIPFEIEVLCEGDSTSGILQGLMQDIVNNVKDSTNNGAVLTHNPTGVNFATEPPLQFAAGVTLTNAQTTAIVNMNQGSFFMEAA